MGGVRRIPVVGVMGSGTVRHASLAEPLGRALARMGVHLLTGGGRGVMEVASKAFHEVSGRAGLVVGVLPARDIGPGEPPGYPNPWVELPIRTHLSARGEDGSGFRSRNPVNVLSSDVVVALPGSGGTASEVELAIRFGRPLILLGDVERAASLPGSVPATEDVEEALVLVRRALSEVDRLRTLCGAGRGKCADGDA